MMHKTIAIIACIASALSGIAQVYAPPAQLTGRAGLSHRWVNHIMQDSRGFLWFSTIDGLNRYDGHDFKSFRPSVDGTHSSRSDDWIWWTVEDSLGHLMVCTKEGMHRFDVNTELFTSFPADAWSVSSRQSLNVIGINSRGKADNLWKAMTTYPWTRDSISFYDFSNNKPGWLGSAEIHTPYFFFSDHQDHAWIWTKEEGWMWWSIKDGSARNFGLKGDPQVSWTSDLPLDPELHVFWTPAGDGSMEFQQIQLPANESFSCENFLRDDEGTWWFTAGSTSPRLYRFDRNTQSVLEIGPLPIPLIYSVCEDKEGTIWVGHQLGVTKFVRVQRLFENYLHIPFSPGADAPLGIACRSMVEDHGGSIYVEDRNALYRLQPGATDAEQLNLDLPLSNNQSDDESPTHLFRDSDGEIWMSVLSGIAKYDPGSGQVRMFEDAEVRGDFFQILEDKRGRFWIQVDTGGNAYATALFDKATGKFSFAKCGSVNLEYGVMQPDADVLWTFHPTGLLKINCIDQQVDSINLYDEIREQRQAVFQGDHMWIASSRGLVNVEMQTWQQKTYNRSNGLPADFVYSILADGEYLWLGTADGLCRFHTESYETKNYFTSDGLSHNEFNTQAVLKTKDGRCIMGGLNGINVFRPEVLNTPGSYQPNLHWMWFNKYDGRTQSVREIDFPADGPHERIVLHHGDKSIAFGFALTSYRDISQNRFTHYLEGLEEDWQPYDASRVISYASIPPGDYVLYVKAMDPNGTESANILSIRLQMLRPWYARWWAFMTFGLCFIGASFLIYRDLLRRRLQHAETRRLHELDAVKTQVYTSITHEFRTPLTIILGLTRQWLRRKDPAAIHEDEFHTVERNGQRLLQLVNQMLDLRKLESGHMQPDYVLGDVTPLLRYIFDSFHSFAFGKGIDVRSEISAEAIIMDHDPDKLMKIVSNLLSNAIRFTPEGGNVIFHAELINAQNTSQFQIRVSDTGAGIAAEDLPNVFNKFFQANNALTRVNAGTGIGLTLTKELVQILGGTIEVKSSPGVGSDFIVKLPVTRHAKLSHDTPVQPELQLTAYSDGHEHQEETADILPGRPCVLIVEDNPEVARYTASCLGKDYQVRFAVNGEEGINKAFEIIPDLVISDVMMPVKDGFELVRAVKQDQRTSHIPVILLTARAEVEDRLEGLRRGADAYLNKPFIEEELRILTAQLLNLRKKLQMRYANAVEVHGIEDAAAEEANKVFDLEIEDAFYRKVLQILEANYDSSSFSNEELYRQMHMSRTQLHRKLAALTGHSPNQLLMQIRLQKAREMLANTDAPVSEVAYHTGFNQPSYFARVFARESGLTPSEYRVHARKK